ncbi:hypothetical protein TNIN_88221 [Trichonephila inaurata madagascariensis]|uniref:Uncharacterized protein n=1 Tax=Trichonephila inaurata madagascariensis TaxID=2747483 RepID=A0A8X6YKZ2_9ARAC|nr:hypothetical protein TNIN_405711 [Trichonephila inaurata madagascariensis]GFY73449.1 hypothetical protein TNIN_88221 [Trichonephila inaurata madagascariensis]
MAIRLSETLWDPDALTTEKCLGLYSGILRALFWRDGLDMMPFWNKNGSCCRVAPKGWEIAREDGMFVLEDGRGVDCWEEWSGKVW